MGQKCNPSSFRIFPKSDKKWDSILYSEGKEYAATIGEDKKIRDLIKAEHAKSQIGKIVIQRILYNNINIIIHAFQPKKIIGEAGSGIEKLKAKLSKLLNFSDLKIRVNYVHKPYLDAQIVASIMARQLEGHASYRAIMKKYLDESKKQGATGVKITLSGRLAGAEIARSETMKFGRVPLHTLRADIRYATDTAQTKMGDIGVKVWIHVE